MKLKLVQVNETEMYDTWRMQQEIFKQSAEEYGHPQDPGNETYSEFLYEQSINEATTFKLLVGDETVGMVSLATTDKNGKSLYKFGIYEKHQNNGYAQETLKLLEKMHPEVDRWVLTVLEKQKKAIHVYKKFGFKKSFSEIYEGGRRIATYQKTSKI